MKILFLFLFLLWTSLLPAQAETPPAPSPAAPLVLLANDAATTRREVVRVTVPFPAGRRRTLADLVVAGRPTAWRVLCRWPDGSVRAAQAQFPLDLKPREILNLPLAPGKAATGPFVPHPRVQAAGGLAGLGLSTRVIDRQGGEYRCSLGRGEEVVLEETPLVRTTRWRRHHLPVPGGGKGLDRDFLSLTTYLTEFRDSPVLVVDLVLGNDYLGADDPGESRDPDLHPLGDIWIKHFDLLDPALPLAFAWPRKCRLGPLFTDEKGRNVRSLLRDTYLADGQCRRWRFHLLPPAGEKGKEPEGLHRRTWQAMACLPLRPLCNAEAWLEAGALSLYGGPACPPRDWMARVQGAINRWQGGKHFGPFGSWGDIKETGTAGTPRNTPASPEWVHAVQTSRGRLLDILLGKAWQQACRPYHMWGLKVEPGDDIFLWTGLPYTVFGGRLISGENLGRKALHDEDPYPDHRGIDKHPWPGPHGWNGYDNEHWTTDLLFDAWLATGDWWCRDELRLLGECAMGLLRPEKYTTRFPQAARCEGWMAHSLVQVWLATGDERYARFLRHRIREILVPAIRRDEPWRTPFIQADYPGTGYPENHRFYMPWQHGPLILGMLAAWRYLGEKEALELCAAAARAVDYARVRGVEHPRFGRVDEGLRYYVPVAAGGRPVAADAFDDKPGIQFGDSPLGGAHTFLALPLWLLAREEAADEETRRIAREVGGLLHRAHRRSPEGRWNKWTFLIPD